MSRSRSTARSTSGSAPLLPLPRGRTSPTDFATAGDDSVPSPKSPTRDPSAPSPKTLTPDPSAPSPACVVGCCGWMRNKTHHVKLWHVFNKKSYSGLMMMRHLQNRGQSNMIVQQEKEGPLRATREPACGPFMATHKTKGVVGTAQAQWGHFQWGDARLPAE